MLKKDIFRSQILSKRDQLDANFQLRAGERLAEMGLQLLARTPIDFCLTYASIRNESSSEALIKNLQKRFGNFPVYYPRLSGSNLEFREAKSEQALVKGKWILEPSEKMARWSAEKNKRGIVFIPGVAFDREGERLGFGKGFYDRFLNQHTNILRIALAYDFQVFPEALWEPEPHDEQMDYIVTPSSVWGSPRVSIL